MQGLKLIIANKKYSSWSLRPWLAMKVAGIEFEEELSPFDMATMHAGFQALREECPTNMNRSPSRLTLLRRHQIVTRMARVVRSGQSRVLGV